MYELAFVLSVALAHGMTNFDNLAMLFALAPAAGVVRTTGAYAVSQTLVVGLAAVVALSALAASKGGAHWLGLLPITLGLFTLWKNWRRSDGGRAVTPSASVFLLILLFLGLGIDSFVVALAIFADSEAEYSLLAVLGFALAIGLLVMATAAFVRVAARAEAWTHRLEALSPFVMILVGVYILLDTPSDLQ